MCPHPTIPNIIREIGRLREVTFREIGEGTNKSIDLDEYDIYYHHLFIWDTEAKLIVGAYRIGLGDEIFYSMGKKGFYVAELFKIKEQFTPVLKKSLELGRSFIRKEYQQKPLPLFLLWKGILKYLIDNPRYRYLIGPVSISNTFSKFSKSQTSLRAWQRHALDRLADWQDGPFLISAAPGAGKTRPALELARAVARAARRQARRRAVPDDAAHTPVGCRGSGARRAARSRTRRAPSPHGTSTASPSPTRAWRAIRRRGRRRSAATRS